MALNDYQLGFERVGSAHAPVVIVQGGITSSCHVLAHSRDPRRGWWNDLVGEGSAVDTSHYRVLSLDYLGGVGASSGPGEHPITSTDQARATVALLDHLGIDRVHAFVGSSYGGMVGLALAAQWPGRLERLVVIGAAHRSHPMATAWRSLQRRVLRLGIEQGCAKEALSVARGMGMTSYRSEAEFAERFSGPPLWRDGRPVFPVEAYLEARGDDFRGSFDCQALHCLSQAIDLHDIDPETIRTPTTVVGVTSDRLVPIHDCEELARRIAARVRYHRIDSHHGHDAFLKESGQLAPILREALHGPEEQDR